MRSSFWLICLFLNLWLRHTSLRTTLSTYNLFYNPNNPLLRFHSFQFHSSTALKRITMSCALFAMDERQRQWSHARAGPKIVNTANNATLLSYNIDTHSITHGRYMLTVNLTIYVQMALMAVLQLSVMNYSRSIIQLQADQRNVINLLQMCRYSLYQFGFSCEVCFMQDGE